MRALRLEEPPAIDGELSDWPTERSSLAHPVFGAGNRSGGEDLSASYGVGWDPTSLYLAIEINDDVFVQEGTGRSLFQGDSAELLFDVELAADFSSAELNSDDFQIGFSPGDFAGGSPEAYRWFPRSVEGRLTTVALSAQSLPDGYQLEGSVPWAVVGVTPNAGDCFGYALSVSDNDQASALSQQSMVSTVPTRNLTDPTTWGTLILADGEVSACRAPAEAP